MHRYTKFHLDIQALVNFLPKIGIDRPYVWIYDRIGFSSDWGHYQPEKFPNIRKIEKMKYLRDLGFTHKEIGSQLGYPLHSVQQFLKRHKDVDVRHFKDHPGMDRLIEDWEHFRKVWPDDLFLKYTE